MPEFDSSVEYRSIPEFPGFMIGSDGTVWSLWKKGHKKPGCVWTRLTPLRVNGYLAVSPFQKRRYIHRLVLEAFVGPCPLGKECCHNDGCKGNNDKSNLRWGTRKENVADNKKHGTLAIGERHGIAKLSAKLVKLARRADRWGVSRTKIARRIGVCRAALRKLLRRETWDHVI